jgi:hypothetical protein
MTPTCPNVRDLFGQVCRITQDEAAGSRNDAWGMIIRGKFGTVYPFGHNQLAVDIDHRPVAARKVAVIPGVRVHQDGGWRGEMTFVFPVDLFPLVAGIVKAKKRRKLSAEQREANIARLAAYKFTAAKCNEEGGFRANELQAG